jgi:hypothetical protein
LEAIAQQATAPAARGGQNFLARDGLGKFGAAAP